MCPRQSLVFWIHSYCWVRDKSIHHIKATLPYHGYFAIPRLFCHSKAILPYQGHFAISRLLCHITATLPYHGYFAIPRLFCHTKVTLPYHGYFAIPRLFCQSKAILPYQSYFAISRLHCYIKATLPPMWSKFATHTSSKTPGSSLAILDHFLWFAPFGATDKWMQRSKQNPPKTFPVKEKCHTIKSAGGHAFPPPPTFLFV